MRAANYILLAPLALALAGCNPFARTTTTSEGQTRTEEKSVTKTQTTTTIDIVADVPNVGPVRLAGQTTETVFSETITQGQALSEQRSLTTNPAADLLVQTLGKVGGKALVGDWVGAGKDLGIALLAAFGIGAGGLAAKKTGENRELRGRVTRSESNEDETYADAKGGRIPPQGAG